MQCMHGLTEKNDKCVKKRNVFIEKGVSLRKYNDKRLRTTDNRNCVYAELKITDASIASLQKFRT